MKTVLLQRLEPLGLDCDLVIDAALAEPLPPGRRRAGGHRTLSTAGAERSAASRGIDDG